MPVSEGREADQTRTHRGRSGGLDVVGLQAHLVNEHQPFQQVTHEGLTSRPPDKTRMGHLRPLDLAGEPRVFYD